MKLKGSIVALVTPFTKSGEINYFKLKELIEFQIASGTNAIVILGTTGESATISDEERTKLIQFSICEVSGRIPVIVGTGSNSTQTAIKQTIEAEKLGADAALIVSPYYNKCNQKGAFFHFKAISKQTKLPIILYNVPSRTGFNLLPETVIKLSKIKNIVAIKEASGNLSQIAEIITKKPPNFSVFSGDDLLTLPILSMGADGVISVTSNCYPSLVLEMCNFVFSGDLYNARRLHNKLFLINKGLFLDINPICIKEYMNIIGMDVGKPRLPLLPASQKIKQKLMEINSIYEN